MPILLYANATCFREHLKKKKIILYNGSLLFFYSYFKEIYIRTTVNYTFSKKKNTTVNYIIMRSKRKVIWEIWMLNHIIINC